MKKMKLGEVVALMHYRRDFKYINQIFKSLKLIVAETNNKLVINDLYGKKIANINVIRGSGGMIQTGNCFDSVTNDYVLECCFKNHGKEINYMAYLDNYGRHQQTVIEVESVYKKYSLSVETPLFSYFALKIFNKNGTDDDAQIAVCDYNLSISKRENGIHTFMDIRYPKLSLPRYDWVLPFQLHSYSERDKSLNNRICLNFHTDKNEYFIKSDVDGENTKLSTLSKDNFDNLCNQAIASDLSQGFYNEMFMEFEKVFPKLRRVIKKVNSGFNDITETMKLNMGKNRDKGINEYISTFGKKSSIPL